MVFAYSCHNWQTLRATNNMQVWWVLLLASVCLGDDCSDIPCEVTDRNVCGYDEVNELNAIFDNNCVMEQCNCRYDAVESSARFVKQDAGNCSRNPYIDYIDECSADNSSEGPPEIDISSSEEDVSQPNNSISSTPGDLMPEDSLEDDDASVDEGVIVSDILGKSKEENVPIDPLKEIDPIVVSEEEASASHEDSGPIIIDGGIDRPPLPPPLVLGKLGSMLLQGITGNLNHGMERKHEPSGQTVVEADINVNIYINEKKPFPPHHKHHGHHPREDSQEMTDKPPFQPKVPMPFPDSGLQNWPGNAKVPMPFEESELPIAEAVQYTTAGSATPKWDALAIMLTSVIAILWGR